MAQKKYVSFFFICLMIAIISHGRPEGLISRFSLAEQEARFIQALEEAKAKFYFIRPKLMAAESIKPSLL
ncbi:MAG: hypothetical protein N3B16_04120 [Candidatus Aminicenantes bacterium]|nr:hypothetical protein [Candidatus Aminicenantes bacterium]